MKRIMMMGAVVASALMAGCASYSGATDSQQIAENIHRIEMRGNAFNKGSDAQDFALVKAAEVTVDNGHRFFTIIDSADRTHGSSYTAPGTFNSTTTTNANAFGVGNYAYGNATSTTSGTFNPGQTYNFVHPGMDLMIATFAEMPQGGAFDAMEVGKYLGADVNPDRWAAATDASE